MPSGDGSVIYSIEERVSDDKVSLIWASAAFSIISGTHHFFAFFFQGWYKINCIVSGVNVARWVDYGLFFLFFFDLLKQIAKKLIFHNQPPPVALCLLLSPFFSWHRRISIPLCFLTLYSHLSSSRVPVRRPFTQQIEETGQNICIFLLCCFSRCHGSHSFLPLVFQWIQPQRKIDVAQSFPPPQKRKPPRISCGVPFSVFSLLFRLLPLFTPLRFTRATSKLTPI